MKKTIFEEMGGTYVRCGDYFIPNLTLPEEEEPRFVGVWGQRHLQYLKEYRRTVYLDLLMSGRLNSYLADIEEQAQERFERIVEQMKLAQGITEQLKADNAWEWVGRMNNIQACAREIVDDRDNLPVKIKGWRARHLLSTCNGAEIYNPNFKPIEFDRFKEKLSYNAFMLYL